MNARLAALRGRVRALLAERGVAGASVLHELEVLHTELSITIEQLQRAERDASEHAAHYQRLFLRVPVALVVLDASLVVEDANAAARALLGAGAIRGTPFDELVAHRDRGHWSSFARQLAALGSDGAGRPASVPPPAMLAGTALEGSSASVLVPELAIRRAGGERRPCRIAFHPHGRGWVAMLEDLAPLRAAESRRLHADARLAQVLRNSTDGVVFVELRSYGVIEANAAFAAFVGLDSSAVRDLAFWDLFAPDPRAYQELRVRQLLGRGGGRATLAFRRSDGSVVHAAATLGVLEGPEQLASVVLRDVSIEVALEEERAALRESRERSERIEALGHLATGVAHDMNNVLAAVLGCAAEDGPPDELRAALSEIRAAATRGRAVTARMMSFARRAPLHAAPFDLGVVVQELTGLLERTLPKTIVVEAHVDSRPMVLAGDEAEWHQALMNLAINARDAMPSGGVLRFVLASRGEGASLVVEDTGVGMTPAVRAHAFEPFFTTKPRGTGTGLGLAHVHAVARSHAVTLECDSTVGVGTRFTFDIPRLSNVGLEPRPVSGPLPLRDRGRVLLVDDDDLARRGTARVLRRLGFDVRDVDSAEAALAQLARGAFDLVVTDLAMPEMDGRALVRLVRELAPELPTLLISGHADAAAEDSTADASLAKPFTPGELRDAIGRARERCRAARTSVAV